MDCAVSPVLFLPQDSKGKNCGTGGSALDLPIDGKCNFDESGKGPGPFWTKLFCLSKQVSSLVPVKQGSRFLVDFARDFQISLWVKSNSNCQGPEILIGSVPVTATRFFFSSNNCDQLALAFSHDEAEFAKSTVDSSDRNDWRHVTVVFKAPQDVQFLRNGKAWPLSQRIAKNPKFLRSTHISVFANNEQQQRMTGHLSGVSIMQKGK